ncbi:single-stranded-DNA-specific exonuclease RecJ [Methanobacterium congolense]|uniref:Uncharacterized protein n=1 Tax=Methanobacterium congolense TaxID=118062 RepID=A0A1D3L5L2_9EURY|nr:DHH family phosphoesterase [Methanobacterium congolense]SCG86872.1 putative protein MJ0831 [Methanobacterium congolense]
MIQKQQHSLLNKAEEACEVLSKHIKKDNVVRIISHNDADGISAAGVVCNAISRQGGKFHVTIVPRLKDNVLAKILREKYKLFFFCDMGSASLSKMGKTRSDVIIADHHQTRDSEEPKENITHVNPHLYGLDGTRDVSASGVSYLTVRPMEYRDLSSLALVGAFGDMQCTDGITSINKTILNDGVDSGAIEVREDLKIAYKSQEPIYKALSYTFNPALRGISGDEEGSMAFFERVGISYGIKFEELGNEEKDLLKEELIKINPKIFGEVYSIPNEIPELRNIEDYSKVLDACGKNKKHGVGLSICIGDRESSVQEAETLLKTYRENLMKSIGWIKREGSIGMENIQYIYTDDKKRKKVMGTLASIGIEIEILDPEKPVLGISRMDNIVKISGRTSMEMVERGVNLGVALEAASKSFNGNGGGHNVAAGAVVPYKDMENFLNIVDEMVGEQIGA